VAGGVRHGHATATLALPKWRWLRHGHSGGGVAVAYATGHGGGGVAVAYATGHSTMEGLV